MIKLSPDYYPIIFVLVTILIYTIVFIITLSISKKNGMISYWVKWNFYSALISGLQNNTITNYDDIVTIFKEVTSLRVEDSYFNKCLDRALQYALYQVYKKNNANTEYKEIILSFKKENDRRNPNAELPDYEKGLFNDIDLYIREQKYDLIPLKLSLLSTSIKTFYDEKKSNSIMTKLSFAIGIIGLILSVIFYFNPCK